MRRAFTEQVRATHPSRDSIGGGVVLGGSLEEVLRVLGGGGEITDDTRDLGVVLIVRDGKLPWRTTSGRSSATRQGICSAGHQRSWLRVTHSRACWITFTGRTRTSSRRARASRAMSSRTNATPRARQLTIAGSDRQMRETDRLATTNLQRPTAMLAHRRLVRCASPATRCAPSRTRCAPTCSEGSRPSSRFSTASLATTTQCCLPSRMPFLPARTSASSANAARQRPVSHAR